MKHYKNLIIYLNCITGEFQSKYELSNKIIVITKEKDVLIINLVFMIAVNAEHKLKRQEVLQSNLQNPFLFLLRKTTNIKFQYQLHLIIKDIHFGGYRDIL